MRYLCDGPYCNKTAETSLTVQVGEVPDERAECTQADHRRLSTVHLCPDCWAVTRRHIPPGRNRTS